MAQAPATMDTLPKDPEKRLFFFPKSPKAAQNDERTTPTARERPSTSLVKGGRVLHLLVRIPYP
jgi:hypothetical protein